MFGVCFLLLHSIEFDRDFDYFAIAGVTKKIKVFPLNSYSRLSAGSFPETVAGNWAYSYAFRADLDGFTLLHVTSLWHDFM